MNIQRHLMCLLAVLSSPASWSQSDDVTEAPKQYQVELIVFVNEDQSRTTREIPRAPSQEIGDILDQDLPKLEATSPAAPVAEITEQESAPLALLTDEELELSGVRERLETLDAYDVIAHRGWVQTAPDVADNVEIDLDRLGIDPASLKGDVSLYKRRYLHLAVDMELPEQANTKASYDSPFSFSTAADDLPAIADSRRMRISRLVYFDHPQFGNIAVVNRYEPKDEELLEDPEAAQDNAS